MRLATITNWAYAATVVLTIASSTTMLLASNATDRERAAVEQRYRLDQATATSRAVRASLLPSLGADASAAAIRKLGARDEGVLKKHKITWTGRVRDTAQFAVLDEDWPDVRRRLDERLAALA